MKLKTEHLPNDKWTAFNRTILELKREVQSVGCSARKTFNRTILELKHGKPHSCNKVALGEGLLEIETKDQKQI